MRIILFAIMLQLVLPFWQPVATRLLENHASDAGHMPICTAVGVAYMDESGEGGDFTPDYHSPLAYIDKSHLAQANLVSAGMAEPVFYASYIRYAFSSEYRSGLSYTPYLSRDPPVVI